MVDPAYPPLPFLMQEFSGGWRNERKKVLVKTCQVLRIPIGNLFGRLKAWLRCLQRAMDTLTQVICSCFVLHNYCQNNKENVPDQNLIYVLRFEKRAQPSTSSLSYGEMANENKVISIRNTLTLLFWIVYGVGITKTKRIKSEVAIQRCSFKTTFLKIRKILEKTGERVQFLVKMHPVHTQLY